MIQRIQSLFLLLATICGITTLFLPLLSFITPEAEYTLHAWGLQQNTTLTTETTEIMWVLAIFTAIIPLISLFSIFLFKHRTIQIRVSVYNMLLMLGFYAIFFLNYYYLGLKYEAPLTIHWPIVLPVVSFILTWLAIRNIAKDEALVQSLNRIR